MNLKTSTQRIFHRMTRSFLQFFALIWRGISEAFGFIRRSMDAVGLWRSPRQQPQTIQTLDFAGQVRYWRARWQIWRNKKRKQYYSRKERIQRLLILGFSTLIFTVQFTGINWWSTRSALAAPILKIEPLTWDFVGLDSNKPETQGPQTYVVGARVCNVGTTDATNVDIRFFKDGIDSAYTFINLQGTELIEIPVLPAANASDAQSTTGSIISSLPGGGGYVFDNPDPTSGTAGSGALYKTKYRINFTPSNCYDAYYNFDVTRKPEAWHTTQRYYIQATADGTGAVRTPRPRQIYIEQLISQSRNYVISFTCDDGTGNTSTPTVQVGDIFTCTAIAHTATAYPQLSFTADFPNIIFQTLDVNTSYSEPAGRVNSAVYADGCGWVQDPTDPRYHKTSSQCEGESQYTDQYEFGSTNGAVGETIRTTYTIKVLGTGAGDPTSQTVDVTNIILDNSGGSYHYNADLGQSPNLVSITIGKAPLSDISVQKTHAGNFTPGANTYTVTIADSGDDRLADGTTPTAESVATKAPVVIRDDLPTGYTFNPTTPVAVGGNSADWVCSLLNSNTAIQCVYDVGRNGSYENFPDNTTHTLTFNVNVDANTAGVNSVNTIAISGENDYNLNNNIDTDATILVNAANLVLTKDDTDADATGFNPSETPPAPSPTIVAGQPITYNFTVSNSSATVTANAPIVLTDTLPTGLTYVSNTSPAGWSCAIEGQNITCTYSQNLAPGASAPVLQLVANTNASGVTSGSSATITNTATVTSPTTDANTVNNTSSDNFLLTLPVSDLTIAKTDFNASFVYSQSGQNFNGENLLYNITIENKGVVATTGNIEIRETLPSGILYTSHTGIGPDNATAINWTCTTGINPTTANACVSNTTTGAITFTYNGTLAPGETAQLNLTVNGGTGLAALPASPKTNSVTVFNANDGTLQPKTDTEDTPVITGGSRYNIAVRKRLTQIGGVAPSPACTITPNATSFGTTESCTATVTPGQAIQYQVIVANNNNAGPDGVNFNLSDFVPNEITITSVTCTATGSQGQNVTECDTGTTGNQGTGGTQYAVTLGLVDNTISPPRYQITQTGFLNKNTGVLTYTFTGTLKSITDLQALGIVDQNVLNRVTVPLTDGANADSIPTDNAATTIFPISITDLSLTKTDDLTGVNDPGSAQFVAGAEGSYLLRVSNIGANATVGEINVVDDLPDEFEYLYASGTGWLCSVANPTNPLTVTDPALDGINNNIVTCSRSTPLAASATSDITVVVKPIGAWISSPETFTNLARVTTPGDTNLTNNGNAPGAVSPNTTFGYEQTPVIAQNVDLAITKSTSSTFTVGQTAAYNLSIVNQGPTVAIASVADPIIVTDILPQGLTFQSAVGAGWSCSATSVSGGTRDKVRCLRTTNMAVNSPSTITLNVFVDGDVASSITNTAYVDAAPANFTGADAGLGADSALNSAETTGYSTDVNNATSRNIHSLTTAVTLASDLSVQKIATTQTSQAEPPQFVAGSVGTYTIKVTNNGPSNYAGNIVVDENLANAVFGSGIAGGSLTFSNFSGTGWTCTNVATNGACAAGNTNLRFTNTSGLNAGSSSSFTLNVNVSGTGATAGDGDPGVATDNVTNSVTVSGATANDPVTSNNTSSEVVDIEPNTAVLSIVKDDDDGDRDGAPLSDDTRFVTGGQGSYFLIVTNNGPATAQAPVQIAENTGFVSTSLPSGLTYQGYDLTPNWSCTGTIGGTTFTCTYGLWTDTNNNGLVGEPGLDSFTQRDMPVGTTSGLELIVGVNSGATPGTLTNTVTADAANANPVTDDEPTLIVQPADLAVTKIGVDSINASSPGNTGSYAVTVRNNGPGVSEADIYLTDYLPDGLTYNAGSFVAPANWSFVSYNTFANQVTFRYTTNLAANAETTINVPVIVTANPPTTARNFVRVTSLTTPETDGSDNAPCDRDLDNFDGSGSPTTQPVNNCAVKDTIINGGLETVVVKKHPLADNGTVDNVDISANGFNTTFDYTIEVGNDEGIDIPDVIIQDTLPESMELNTTAPLSVTISPAIANVNGNNYTRSCSYKIDERLLTCNLGTVDVLETVASPVRITLTVKPTVSGIITNTVGYLSGGSNTDSESVNIINAPTANIISGSVFADSNTNGVFNSPTEPGTANITVNLYRDNNNNGVIDPNDALLASTITDVNGAYSFSTPLTGNFIVAVDTTDTDLPSTTFTTATVLDVVLGTSDTGNNFGHTAAALPTVDIGITKTDSADPINVGDSFNYTLTVSSDPTNSANNVVVTDTIPASLTINSVTPTCTRSGQVVTCNLGTVAANSANQVITINVTSTVSGTVTNTATVTTDNPESNSANNTATEQTVINSPVTGGTTCYVASDGADLLLTLNLNTLTATPAPNGFGVGANSVEALAYNPFTGILYGADANQLGTINTSTGVFTAIAGVFGTGDGALGSVTFNDIDSLAFNPYTGELFGAHRRDGAGELDVLIKIDTQTGQFIPDAFGLNVDYLVINTGATNTNVDDITIDPFDGTLYAIANPDVFNASIPDQFVRVNLTDGSTTVIGSFGIPDVEGLTAFNNGNIYLTTGEEPAAGIANSFYSVNKISGLATQQVDLSSFGIDYEGVTCLTGAPNFITGRVFLDDGNGGGTVGDGILNGTEAGTDGVTVRLYRDVDGNGTVNTGDILLITQVTSGGGNYSFGVAATGAFVLDIDTATLPAGQALTSDNVEVANFGTSLGVTDANNNFGHNAAPTANLLLAKRITAVRRNGVDLGVGDRPGGQDVAIFNDFGTGADEDNAANWPTNDDIYLRGALNGGEIRTGDEVEYTIYFLNNGSASVQNVTLCDVVPDNMTYVPSSMSLFLDNTPPLDSPTSPNAGTYLTALTSPNSLSDSVGDGDRGAYYAPGILPQPTGLCKRGATNITAAADNTTGAVVIKVVDSTTTPNNIAASTAPGTPTNSYGFIRFRAVTQ